MNLIGLAQPIPRVRPQLWPDKLGDPIPANGGDNCNVKTTQAQAEFGGAAYPTIDRVRTLMGAPKFGGTTSDQAMKALRALGLAPVRLASFAALEDAWADPNLCVSIATNNGWTNANLPELSGDRRFDGNHRVLTYHREQVRDPGPVYVMFDDPTHDGRVRSWGKAPKGPLVVRRADVFDMMAATGYFSAIAMRRG